MTDASPPRPKTKSRWLRIGLLLGALAAAAITLQVTGWADRITVKQIELWVEAAGAWGAVLFVVVFCVGELFQLPGMLFIGAGVVIFGRTQGFLLGLLAAELSVCFSFLLIRFVGGSALGDIERPFVKRMLARLDKHPWSTVILLRLVLWISPPLNYALALTRLKFVPFAVGSLIGMSLPIAVAAFGFDALKQLWS